MTTLRRDAPGKHHALRVMGVQGTYERVLGLGRDVFRDLHAQHPVGAARNSSLAACEVERLDGTVRQAPDVPRPVVCADAYALPRRYCE